MGIDAAEGELLSGFVAGLSEGVVLKTAIVAMVVLYPHAVFSGECLESSFGPESFLGRIVDLEVDEAQAAEMVNEDGGASVALLGKFPLHLRKESDFGGCHLVDGDALPRLGCDEDLVRGLGLFTAPRNFSHRAEEASSALGWLDFRQLLGDFPVEGELLELCEGERQTPSVQKPSVGAKRGMISWSLL